MKKFTIFALAVILVLSLTACGRRKDEATQDPSTTPETLSPTQSTPTEATNIPDPTVNENSTENTDGMDQMLPDSNNETTASESTAP